MGSIAFSLAAAALLANAPNPLEKALGAAGGTLCYERTYDSAWLKAHRGQSVRVARLALVRDSDGSGARMRMSLSGTTPPHFMYGECSWYKGDLNRDVRGEVLDPSFKFATGVGCHLYTDVTGVSAEEGGDFPAAWEDDGRVIQVHLPDGFASWTSRDVRKTAGFHDLGAKDRILRLRRVAPANCRELVKTFAPDGI